MTNKSDEAIKVNDMVMVIKSCNQCLCRIMGRPFIVSKIIMPPTPLTCGIPGVRTPVQPCAMGMGPRKLDGQEIIIPLTWLKKFPPQEELERENAELYGLL